MFNARRDIVDQLRAQYPKGCRVELEKMDDDHAPPVGALGTVIGVDDIGSIMVAWDCGSSLYVALGAGRCRRVG